MHLLSVKQLWIAFLTDAIEETAVLALPLLRVKQIRAIATTEFSLVVVNYDCFDDGIVVTSLPVRRQKTFSIVVFLLHLNCKSKPWHNEDVMTRL